MTNKKKAIIAAVFAAVWLAVGFCAGFFTAKGIYDRPVIETITRDTVTVVDTIPHYYPQPVDGTKVKTEYRWLTRVEHSTDTLIQHDSVLVEVPIESRHYHEAEFDAWVSGYEPSLDSIKVYQKTEYINTTITQVVKDGKHFFFGVAGGCEYGFNDKSATPFAELGLTFKPGRWSIGASGGYQHNGATNTGEPYARIKLSYDIISF